MSENADILTNATATIERLRTDISRTEREFDAVQIKLEVMRDLLAQLTGEAQSKQSRKPRRVWPVASEEPPTFEPPAAA